MQLRRRFRKSVCRPPHPWFVSRRTHERLPSECANEDNYSILCVLVVSLGQINRNPPESMTRLIRSWYVFANTFKRDRAIKTAW